MKKIKFLFSILLVFLFFKCENVYAAQELTCIYKGGMQASSTMLVQTAEGKFFVYTNSKNNTPLIDDTNWYSIDENAVEVKYEWDTGYYENGVLTDCPSYTRYKAKTNTKGVNYTFYFYGEKTWHLDYEFYKKYNQVPNKSDFKQYFTEDEDYSEEIKNTQWIGTCNYEDVILYFNREKLILDNKNSLIYSSYAGFSLNELLAYYDQIGTCPTRLYQRVDQTVVSVGNTFQYVTYLLNNDGNNYEEKLIEDGSSINDTKEEEKPKEDIDDCLDLFSQEFIDEINSYLLIVRIAVPILLIVLGTLDFAKAVFSSSEDEMKKAQSKFMKRVIAAVLVFLIPVLVNLLLDIANSVWSYIDPNSCNIG